MNIPEMLGCVAAFTACAIALVWCGAFLYQRGTVRASVTPPILNKILHPEPKPPTKPVKGGTCGGCSKYVRFQLSDDESLWTCPDCNRSFDGPQPKLRT